MQAVGLAVVTGNLLKAVSGRKEPVWYKSGEARERSRDFDIGFWKRGIYNGWPSGHAITNTAMAAALANYYQDSVRIRTLTYGWAASVMASATFGFQGDVHWASDVVAGGLMGWVIGRTVGKSFAGRGRTRLLPDVSFGSHPAGLSLSLLF